MFARDRDLLILEPTLFREIAWLAQRLITATGDITGGTLSLSAHDVSFEDAGVDAGHIVLIGPSGEGVAHEILERLSPTEVSISRPREHASAPAITPAPTTDAHVEVWTFAPQIALAHDQLMHMVGIDTDATGHGPSPDNIINIAAIRALEALTALHHIFIAAAGTNPGTAAHLFAKAEIYRQRATIAREQTPVYLDLTGSGAIQATRRFHITTPTR